MNIISKVRSALPLFSFIVLAGCSDTNTEDLSLNETPQENSSQQAPSIQLPKLDSVSYVFMQNASVQEMINNIGGNVDSCSSAPSLPTGLLVKAEQGTCQIFGTPSSVSEASSYVITATNARGKDDVVITVSVKADSQPPLTPPQLAAANLTGLINTELMAVVTNSGGQIEKCTSSPALPDGLTVNATIEGCKISGQTAVISKDDYQITGENRVGADTATLTLDIDQPLQKPVISKLNNVNLVVGDAADIRFTNIGGEITNCQSSPQVSHGLTLTTQPNACVISGTVNAAFSQRYDITASNAAGNSKAHVRIITNAALQQPDLADIGSYKFDSGQMVSISVVNNGGQLAECTVDPQLPSGLTISESANTCLISGISDQQVDNQSHAVTATNASGSSNAQLILTLAEPVVRTAQALTLDVEADAYTNAGSKSGDTFNIDRLLSQSSAANYTRETYLAFQQQNLPTTEINNAYLKVFVDEITTNPGTVEVEIQKVNYSDQADNDRHFDETQLNYTLASNFMVNGAKSSAAFNKASHEQKWVWIDVSDAIGQAHDYENLQLKIINSDEIKPSRLFIQSKEHSDGHSPQLLINADLMAPVLSISENNFTLQTEQPIIAKALSQGGLIESCTLAQGQTLPVGLTLSHENFACVVTGSTSFQQAATVYTVTATNGAGSSDLEITLTVEAPASAPSITGQTLIVIENTAINVLLENTGDAIDSCTLASTSPALPNGLNLETRENGCLLMGSVSQDQPETNYIIIASNVQGDSAADFTLIVNDPAPELANANINQAYTQAINLEFTNSGGAADSCTIDPQLPSGLAIAEQNNTCALSGSLAQAHNQTYTVTATNETGSDTAQVQIILTEPATKPKLLDGTVGIRPYADFSVVLENTGGAIESCSGDTFIPVPATVSVVANEQGCLISGYIPSDEPDTFFIAATNEHGTDYGILRFTINDPAPVLQGASFDKAFDNTVEINLNNNGGAVDECVISPDLPSGLNLVKKNDSCAIEGNLAQVYNQVFTVTGTNETASSAAQVTINLTRPLLIPDLTDVSLTVLENDYFTTTLVNSTDPIENCQADPNLAVGLTLVHTEQGCHISGAVADAMAATTYVISATNITGTGTANFVLEVTEPTDDSQKPELQNPIEHLIVEKSDPVDLAFVNKNTENVIDSCEIASGELPTGLTLSANNNTCQITGSVNQVLAERLITINVGHSGETVTAALYLTIKTQKPRIEDAVMEGPVSVFQKVTFKSSRGNIQSCSISPNPPHGLYFFKSSCTLQGSQDQHYVNKTFTVTAKNNGGSDTAILTVNFIEPIKKPQISQHHKEVKVRVNETVSASFSNGGRHNPIESCNASPDLPAGLTLVVGDDNESCEISGSVANEIAETDYQIIASNEAGNSNGLFTLDIRSAVVGDVHSITTNPSDAVFVDQTEADNNYHGDRNLHVNAVRDAFMRFQAEDLADTKIEKVYLKAFVILFDRKDPPLQICSTATGWEQETLTHNQVPADIQCQDYQLDNDDLAFWKFFDVTDLVKDNAGLGHGNAISLRLSIPEQAAPAKTPRAEFASERTNHPRRHIAPVLYVNPHKQLAEFVYDEDVLQFRIGEERKYVSPTIGGTPEQCTIEPALPTGIDVYAKDFSCVISSTLR